MSGVTGIKQLGKRTVPTAIAGRIAFERAKGVRRLLGRKDGGMGATHRGFELDQSLDYVDGVFEDYLNYGGVDRGAIQESRILELGPGDNFGVALRFLAAGADRVVSVDRFIPYRDDDYHRKIYGGLIDRLDEEEAARIRPVLDGDPFAFEEIGLQVLEETPIEDAPAKLGGGDFDLIVSRAVLEHVYDLPSAFDAMWSLLKPGGRMIHKVDLSDHGLFLPGGHNPLTFLTISDRVYGWMGEIPAGLPNRRRIDLYRAEMGRTGFDARFLITQVAGDERELERFVPLEGGLPKESPLAYVRAVRPRLNPRFSGASDEELAIVGFFLIADKPR